MGTNQLRNLPAVHEILESGPLAAYATLFTREQVVEAIRIELDLLRRRVREGKVPEGHPALEAIAECVKLRLEHTFQPKLRSVINATGIVLHTNLGRAPIAQRAAQAAYEAASGYLNLELDLETGKRSSRQAAIREWVCRLTDAESATAVNNNAAATVLALRALCQGKEVIISRGQLIEIGGSFRIPEIMAVSGAILKEVGTTNITRLSDYEKAISPNTAALLQVHSSNYRISGFTHTVPLAELAALGKKHDLHVIDDIGSGALVDFGRFGFSGEPIARASIAAGADLVLFSGDKLLGGPQAGILAGRRDLIQRIEKDPLMRAFRLDKMTLAALETTLRLYLDESRALREIPVLRMLGLPLEELHDRAVQLADSLARLEGVRAAQAVESTSFVGGGSLPDQRMKSWVVQVQVSRLTEDELARRLRTGAPAVLGRLQDGWLLLDLRTVFPEQESIITEAFRRALQDATGTVQAADNAPAIPLNPSIG